MLELMDPAALAVIGSQFFIVVARLSFVIFLLPGLGEQMIPIRVRVMILIALSVAFTSIGMVAPVSLSPLSGFVAVMAGEIAVGFVLGVSLRLAIWILGITGTVVAQSIGLAQFMGVGLETEAQTIFANMLSLAGAALLLTANYHVSAFQSFAMLYGVLPVGGYTLLDLSAFTDLVFAAFNFGVSLAWPFVTVSLIYNISLGFINKAMPQLMVAFVGAPFMVGAGLFILFVSIVSIMLAWQERLPSFVPWM